MYKQIKQLKNKHGIGLIEIIISISVLAIGILGLLQAFPRAAAVQRTIELETIGNQLAQEKLELLAAVAYEDISVGTIENQVRVETDSTHPLYDFTRTTVVELLDQNMLPSGPDVGIKKITITIGWPRPLNSAASTSELITIVSER
jgi:type II secretory pathway pseudopilin PulG